MHTSTLFKNASRADCSLLVCKIQVLLPWSKGGAASVLQNYVLYLFTTYKIDRSRAQVKECIYFLTQSFVIKNHSNNSPDIELYENYIYYQVQ